MSRSLAIYRWLTTLGAPLAPPLLRWRASRGKEDPSRMGERLGYASRARPGGRLIWLHGASVGEALSILPLAEALERRQPEASILITSGTRTSAELLAQRMAAGEIHQYAPVDTPGSAARFLDHWRPDLAVFVESEIWPNLLMEARRRGVRTALVSARMSRASLRRWARTPGAARTLLGGFDMVLAQDDVTGVGLAELGGLDAGRLNLKLVGEPLPANSDTLDPLREGIRDRPVLLAASTHPGEEDLLLEVFEMLRPREDRPLLVIVPRHPARGPAIAALARGQGMNAGRRSAGDVPTASTEVYVADTLGELGLWFRLARVAFIGGSLAPGAGGHNPLEAARLHCPAIAGPHVDNWRPVYEALEHVGGVRRVGGAAGLAGAFAEALEDGSELGRQAAYAQAFADGQADGVGMVAARLLDLALGLTPRVKTGYA